MKWKMTSLFLVPLVLMTVACTCINLAAAFYFLTGGESSEKTVGSPFFSYSTYTRDFQHYITFTDGKPKLTSEGVAKLTKRGAWFQIIDESGMEVYALYKPKAAPVRYTPGELVHYYKYDNSIEGSTLFTSWLSHNGTKWTYIVGYPMEHIAKYITYFSPFRIMNFWKEGIVVVLGLNFLMVLTLGYIFGRRLTRPLVTIINGIKALARGQYTLLHHPRGLYKDVYHSLNQLADALQAGETQRVRLEKMREEWVTNLSHDIKTPLASIKGYGEVLADPEYDIAPEEQRKYADIIVGKTHYIEKLVDDLRLTYQLKNHLLPLHKREENVVDIVREIIIDLLNDPQYAQRDIEFAPACERIGFTCDRAFLTRAFTNLIYNAVIHNPVSTRMQVHITKSSQRIEMLIADNGQGIPEEEIEQLFTRYYRGTNTSAKHQGSGLGMAIAKQIIEAHQGEIEVKSEAECGTQIRVLFRASDPGADR
ncbi:sensor histidine kinase [Aneurinibacillus sp. REN35]|uniref:sensor histidine kinase n=1 Tax=Aneurinibacillus sp. REN35 TaxID=3237286 RepID=UPI0035296680